jgi:hypothetical protein
MNTLLVASALSVLGAMALPPAFVLFGWRRK